MPALSRSIIDVCSIDNTLSSARSVSTLVSAVLALEESKCIAGCPRARCTAALSSAVILLEEADHVPAAGRPSFRPRSVVLADEPDIDDHQAEQRQ